MSDIVERLRLGENWVRTVNVMAAQDASASIRGTSMTALCLEAALEIERLRKVVDAPCATCGRREVVAPGGSVVVEWEESDG